MDKHTLSYYLLDNIDNDEFLQRKYKELLIVYSKSLFSGYSEKYNDEYRKLLRYAEILSLSDKEKHQNMAQQIVILLDSLFSDETEIKFFKQNIYTNVSNFASANMMNQGDRQFNSIDILRNVEVEAHKIANNIPDTDKQFFDTQRIALCGIENNRFYSFSAPTSMGKTFIITNFIRNEIKKGSKYNFVIIVPTRALLSEIANKMINEFSDILGVGKHKVITAMASLQNNENFIAVLTPERLYYALLKQPFIKYKYIFIDEAHKISDKDKRSIVYYKLLDMLKSDEDINIYFSSPVIPNPDIYLELTNYYSLSNNHANGQAFEFSPVVQNKICIDIVNKRYSIINNLSKENVDCDNLPVNITDKMSALLAIGKNKRNLVYVSSANKAINYAIQLSKIYTCESDEGQEELERVAKLIEQKIHKEYYLANLIRKRVAYHIGALPAEVRANIEYLIRNKIIRYCFCTSTLLEGVNVPVDNLFVFDNKKANTKMSEVDAFNLMGRAGRVTLNEYGNVFLFVGERGAKNYYNDVLLKPLPNQTLLPTKALKQSSKRYIVEILLKGRTNLLELGENYSDRGFTETTYEYAAKCLNMLLHDICNQNDSYIVRDFRKEKVLSPQNIIDIRKKFGGIVSKDDDINLSARQKESLYKAVKERNLNYPKTLDYNTCLSFLMQLSTILRWDIYEKETLGKGQRIRYYTVILTQWMQSRGLHEIIRGAIEHYQQNGGNLVSFEPEYHLEPYNNSAKHKNQVINEVMKDLEHVINYKLSMYFLRLSEAIVKTHGKTALENDWYEYVEYGTCNIEIILLQKYGFLREEALLLLKPNYSDYIRIDNQTIKIRRNIVDVVADDLHSSLKTIMINYPEIFID